MSMKVREWIALTEAIRASGNAELNRLLDRYHRKLFTDDKTCWVAGARRHIAMRAAALGVAEKADSV